MANNMLNTRIRLKYDTFENWSKESAKTLVLLEGELAVVSIPTGDTQTVNSVTPPQVLFKVGDGVTQFQNLPWASALAADVYLWAKQSGLFASTEAATSTSGDKTYTGNAITSVEWDSTLNGNKGGLKFVKGTQFATKAELDAALAAFDGEIGSITDSDTRYSFEVPASGDNKGKLAITATKYVNGSAEGNGTTTYYDFVTPEELAAALAGYYTKSEVDTLIQGVRDDIPTELGVMDVDGENAIEVTGDANKVVKLKINSNKGNVTFDNSSDGLRANVDLSNLVPMIKVNNAGHADSADSATNASKLGGELPSYYATAGYVAAMENALTSGAFQVGAAKNADDADKLGGQAPSYYAVDSLVVHSSEKGNANGVATLGADGKVPTSQLPSYVDDVLTYASKSGFPTSGETGKIYVAEDTNITYRWSGTQYVEISASLALGETSSTAYAGDKGKALADKVVGIENDIAANRADWAAKTQVTDPTSGDGKITVNGTELTVYDDSGLKTRVQNIEEAYISSVNGKAADDNGSVTLTGDDIEITLGSDAATVQETVVAYGEMIRGILDSYDEYGRVLKAADADKLDGHNSNYFATAQSVTDLSDRVDDLEDAVVIDSDNNSVEIKAGGYLGLGLNANQIEIGHQGGNTGISGNVVLGEDGDLNIKGHAITANASGLLVAGKELAYKADIPTNVVQYYEGTSLDEEEPVFIFCCGSASKLV